MSNPTILKLKALSRKHVTGKDVLMLVSYLFLGANRLAAKKGMVKTREVTGLITLILWTLNTFNVPVDKWIYRGVTYIINRKWRG